MLSAKEVALEVTKALDEKKGMDIKLLRIEKVSTLADYFLICTGTSNTHVKTLCDYAEYVMEQLGEPMLGREGRRSNSWDLLDFGTLVVHVFTDEARKFYDLERLWRDAEVVDLDGNTETFSITTTEQYVGAALQAEGLIQGEDGPYGLYVKTVNGITYEYETDGCYWAFYINGEYGMSGVDITDIVDGACYAFKAEK